MFEGISTLKEAHKKVWGILAIKTTGKKNKDGVPILSIIGGDSQASVEVNAKPFYQIKRYYNLCKDCYNLYQEAVSRSRPDKIFRPWWLTPIKIPSMMVWGLLGYIAKCQMLTPSEYMAILAESGDDISNRELIDCFDLRVKVLTVHGHFEKAQKTIQEVINRSIVPREIKASLFLSRAEIEVCERSVSMWYKKVKIDIQRAIEAIESRENVSYQKMADIYFWAADLAGGLEAHRLREIAEGVLTEAEFAKEDGRSESQSA